MNELALSRFGVDDVLREDHFLLADSIGIIGADEIAREEPDAVLGVVDDLRLCAAQQHHRDAGGEVADVDGIAHLGDLGPAVVRPSRRLLRSLLRMRFSLCAITNSTSS